MAQTTGRDVLSAAFSQKEWDKVPQEIAKKLETYIGDKFEELITARALLETKSYNAVHSLSEVQGKHDVLGKEHDETVQKLEGANQTIAELEKQLGTSVTDVSKLQVTCNKLEHEVAELRNSRNLVSDERDELSRMIERRNAEVDRLQTTNNTLSAQLTEAVNTKCEALAKMNEVDSMKLSIEFKEKRMEQERSLLNSQMKNLADDLAQKTEELLNMRRDNTSRCVQLDIKLSERTRELTASAESIKKLTESNGELAKQAEELAQKLASQKNTFDNTMESFEQEVEAQKKIANLYKEVSDEKTSHAENLTKAVQELKEQLDEALEKYGDLETKHKETELVHEEILLKKNECIGLLKKELETANELLNSKKDSSARDVEEISPSAAAASRLIKSGMTMTEIYREYFQAKESLAAEKEENNRLQSYIQSICSELEDKGPLIAKQREDYEQSLETIEELTRRYDNLIQDNQQLRDTYNDIKRTEAAVARENGRLKKENFDLGRQVCHLLRDVEHSRAGSSTNSTDQDLSDSTCSADIITKRLVTFSDINDLQTNNQKLLALVRELSSKQEEAELMGGPEVISNLKMKLDSLRESNAELLEQHDKQNGMVKMIMEQRDTYKTLYSQCIKGANIEDIHMDRDKSSPSPKGHDDTDMQTDDKLHDLEQALEKAKKELTLNKEELETYKKEKSANEKILIEQSEKMRSELQELMRQNTKLSTKCETLEETIKILKNNAGVYKNQIEKLEERNKIYSESIVKHETAQQYLNNQLLDLQTKLSKSEVMLANLQKENVLLREAESRLTRERDSFSREQQSHTIMQTNIELIKATLERNDAESKIRLEETLKEAHRECSALRRRMQEEQDRFRELSEHLEKQTQTAQERMQEEKQQADKLRDDLNEAREDLTTKSKQLEELSKKLKSSMLTDIGSVESKKFREMEQMLIDSQAEAEIMKQKLKLAKEAVDQHYNVAQGAEKQLIDLNEKHTLDTTNFKKAIEERDAKLAELEEKCSELQGELSLQSDGQVNVTSSLHGKLNKLEIQHKVAASELTDTKQELEAARGQIKVLTENLETAENKYTREMSLHSNDLQTLKTLKEDFLKIQGEVNTIKVERDKAQEALNESKSSWENQEEHFKKEKLEVEIRLKDLDKQNTLLLDQLQELNTQMSVMQAQLTEPLNKSMGDSSFNKSFTEDEIKPSEQLLKIIKYLRQEKDIAVSKCEILDAEFSRVRSQQEHLQKQFDEAKEALESERQKSEVSIVTAAKHAEVLRKVETLNAITDSNRSLRIERDGLLSELTELKARTTVLEDQMAPLQEKNKELQKKSEAMHTENITLRGEATRWRQRANILIEKSNRTSPEDWKKLQGERESLVKQLTIEKSNTVKLNEEVNSLTRDRTKLEEQVKSLRHQQETQKIEMDKLNEELAALRTQVSSLTEDLEQTRNSLIRMTEDNRNLTESLAGKDVMLTDVKNNLAQIRKIAKKYKIQFEELTKETETLKQELLSKKDEDNVSEDKKEELMQVGRAQVEERITQLEQSHTDRVNELNQQVTTTSEENEKNKREIEVLKENLQVSLEKEERFKVLFKNAKDRIMNLTEHNNSLKAQVKDEASKSSETSQQSTSSLDVERVQKEKEEILAEKQQEKERYLQEIETLNQRINQLQRQLGLQQGSKPSTSSEKDKSTTEPPTANIKPMAGHSTNTQTQSVPIQPWRSGGEPPLASIRPMSHPMQLRTAAVLPTSQSPSTVMVPPQQQVHTTGSSSSSSSAIEAMSSSPTSSHTDYVPATSSASSMLGPRQVAVPPTQSNQDTEDEDINMQVQVPQQQAVALVLPRVEPPSPAQEQGTSSSSSNTVTTTQAGHKRPREADTETQHEDQGKGQQQPKRTRVSQGTSSGAEGSVSESGLEVEYQVPTSSQRDHEDENNVIVVESDEEGPDEGEGEDYGNMPYEDPDTQDPDQDDEGGNEVEVIEDSSEVPNQSERGAESDMMQADGEEEEECEDVEEGDEEEVMQPEATSSGTNVSTSVAVTLPSRTRQVAPLSRQQQTHLLLPHGIEEGGDDGIVPSTPTLFVARRCDGFGEAVSSPHVPTSGRFTFTESGPPNNIGSNDVLPEQTLEMANVDDNSTGRSVPSTPLQTSPHESGPSGEEQTATQGEGDIPTVTVSGGEDEAEAVEGNECMGPPSVAGTSAEVVPPSEQPEEHEGDDGVSSEGEKAASTEEGEEEGREAEASPSTNTRSRNNVQRGSGGVARRSSQRQSHVRGISRSGPTPIVWADQQNRAQSQRQDMGGHRGGGSNRGNMGGQNYSPRTARRSRGRNQRSPYPRF